MHTATPTYMYTYVHHKNQHAAVSLNLNRAHSLKLQAQFTPKIVVYSLYILYIRISCVIGHLSLS